MFAQTNDLQNITINTLINNPQILSILRLCTAPPIARDRLIGLSKTNKNLIDALEKKNIIPPRMQKNDLENQLNRILDIIIKLLDVDIFPWLEKRDKPSIYTKRRSASIIADRVCGAISDPLIRNEQEKRQLTTIKKYLNSKGYTFIESNKTNSFYDLPNGSFSFHLNFPVNIGTEKPINIPIDVAIKRRYATPDEMPIMIECKSAGDFTNTNKRRKEEAQKIAQLKYTYGNNIVFLLFLCGYFDSSYLGYEAAEGIDWIWEHRITDFEKLDL